MSSTESLTLAVLLLLSKPIRHITGRFHKNVIIYVRKTKDVCKHHLIYVIQRVLCKLFEVPVNIATVLRAGQQRSPSIPGGVNRLFSKASREIIGPKYRPFLRV